MPAEEDSRSRADSARSVDGDALAAILRNSDESIIRAALENPRLEEKHLCILLERLDLPAAILEIIGARREWIRSEKVKVRLARHPNAPRQIVLRLVRQLYLFDLTHLSLLSSAPAEVRRLAEEVIVTKIPQLPLGQKITLARRASSRVAGALVGEGHPQVLKIALENGTLTESQILKVLSNSNAPELVVMAIAQHPKWSARHDVRMALLRNARAPYPVLLSFLAHLSAPDLKDIASLDTISPQLRKHIDRELGRRASE